jgi:NAD(P)-dependent dehydrogenase (short-subunit alcohol dehydrogenase family)
MSSLSGQAGMQAFAAYTVAKHDAAELTKPPALEYGDQKLRVSAICPVAVDKPHVE